MTVTKADLAKQIMDHLGLNMRESKDMVEAFFAEIANCLESGEEVKLSGFGTFQLRDKSARPGRNPKTGEEVLVTARRVISYYPSTTLKSALDQAILQTA